MFLVAFVASYFDFVDAGEAAKRTVLRFLHPLQEAAVMVAMLTVKIGVRSLIQANGALFTSPSKILMSL